MTKIAFSRVATKLATKYYILQGGLQNLQLKWYILEGDFQIGN